MQKIFASLCLSTLTLVACSSDSTTATSTDAGNGADSSSSDSSAKAETGAPDAGGDAAPSGPDCASYCATIQANCTATNAQFPSLEACKGYCAALPVGALSDTAGNTLGCREYHAGAASSNATLHCPHAGPTGGGLCGDGCDAFCAVAQSVCTGTNAQWPDVPTCVTACKAFPAAATPFTTAQSAGNTFGCRAYHLSVAASSVVNAMAHCPHIATVSTVCK